MYKFSKLQPSNVVKIIGNKCFRKLFVLRKLITPSIFISDDMLFVYDIDEGAKEIEVYANGSVKTKINVGTQELNIINSRDSTEKTTFVMPQDLTYEQFINSRYDISNNSFEVDSDGNVLFSGLRLYTDASEVSKSNVAKGDVYYDGMFVITCELLNMALEYKDYISYKSYEPVTFSQYVSKYDVNSGFTRDDSNNTKYLGNYIYSDESLTTKVDFNNALVTGIYYYEKDFGGGNN